MEQRSVTGCMRVLERFVSFHFPLAVSAERWAAAVQTGNSVIAFSVPEADLPALNQKRQSLSVMAQLIIKHVSYLRWAPPIYFHLSDKDGCTNSINTINKGNINIALFSENKSLISCPMAVYRNSPQTDKETSHVLILFPWTQSAS